MLGTSEVAPVDLGMDRPHRVMAAYWWGSEDVLGAVLDGLAELPSRQHVTLDLRAPLPSPRPPTPRWPAASAMSGSRSTPFKTEILEALLTSRAGELTGLVACRRDAGTVLKKPTAMWNAGQTVQAVPMAVPADYAAFTVLGR